MCDFSKIAVQNISESDNDREWRKWEPIPTSDFEIINS